MVQATATVRTLLYKIIYHPAINRWMRAINRLLQPVTSFQLPPSGILSLQLHSGVSFKLMTNPTSHVSRVLYYQGPDEFEYTKIFERLISRCKSFADVGANTGYYSILAAKINPGIRVIAFEPAPGPLHYLRENVVLNQVQSVVEIALLALSDKSGTLKFQPAYNPKYSFLANHLGGTGHVVAEGGSTIEVPADTLDHFLGDRAIDLIKMDTEGTEDQILNGAGHVISSQRPIIICELLFNKIEGKLESAMKSHGYEFYQHRNKRLEKVVTLMRATDNGVRDCFFVPPEKSSWVQEFVD